MKCADPACMTASERFAEIADILARGYVRFVVREKEPQNVNAMSQEPLDVIGQAEAPCGFPTANPKTTSKA